MTAETDLNDAATAFDDARRRLFGIAYRILGSAAEAEDVVQDAWLRWQTTDRTTVANPDAMLTTIVTRLAINVLRSAHRRREVYPGPWLPEPVDTSDDPTLGAERAEALDLAVLTLMERLTATERAAFVLREAFDYEYADIATILQLSPVAARQVVSRARKHLASARRKPVDAAAQRELLDAFLGAARAGDVARLEHLFADNVLSRSDGGGLVRNVSRVPVVGRDKVAKFIHAFTGRFWSGMQFRPLEVNGAPAAALVREETLVGVVALEVVDGVVHELFWVMNPQKLALLAARHGLAAPPETRAENA